MPELTDPRGKVTDCDGCGHITVILRRTREHPAAGRYLLPLTHPKCAFCAWPASFTVTRHYAATDWDLAYNCCDKHRDLPGAGGWPITAEPIPWPEPVCAW